MARSGGPYESYSYAELHELRRECQNFRGSGFHVQSEDRAHAYQVSMNNQSMLEDIRAELDFRDQDKADREAAREERDQQRVVREKAKAERLEKEREGRRKQALDRRNQAAVPAAVPDPSIIYPSVKSIVAAVSRYFRRTNIADPPKVTVTRVELSWTHNNRQYLGTYNPEQDKLEAWILVADGVPGATQLSGKEYLPAGDNKLIHQAHVAEAKSRRRN